MNRLSRPMIQSSLAGAVVALLAACAAQPYAGPARPIRYSGSSTIAHFIRDAQAALGQSRIEIDTTGESLGGERAILEGKTDLAGVAGRPVTQHLPAEVRSAVVGRDAIAVIANSGIGIDSISSSDLRRIFTGQLRNWKPLTGRDLAIRPLIVDAMSATRRVFRAAVLADADYDGCEVVKPDLAIVDRVARTAGAIGHISVSFLRGSEHVRALTVDGEAPSVTNFSYPIARPLYLLWRAPDAEVKAFVDWTLSSEGQKLIMRHFVGNQVVAAKSRATGESMGFLVVSTETYPVYDGGINYYPHRPYDLLTRHGELIRHVRNHQSQNDEKPARIALPPGRYLIRPFTAKGRGSPFFVDIEPGKTTSVVARGDHDATPGRLSRARDSRRSAALSADRTTRAISRICRSRAPDPVFGTSGCRLFIAPAASLAIRYDS